jgi:hypothetical protein
MALIFIQFSMLLPRPDSYRDNRDSIIAHSVRSDFTGLAMAALID